MTAPIWTREEELAREVWKQAIDLQKHFNDIHFRLRAFFFGFLGTIAAVVTGLVVSGKAEERTDLLQSFPSGSAARFVIAVFLLAPGFALWVLDRFYYHPLLAAAVDRACEIEKDVPGLKLSSALRDDNQQERFFFVRRGRAKVTLFYGTVSAAMMGLLHADDWSCALRMTILAGFVFFMLEILHPPKTSPVLEPQKQTAKPPEPPGSA